MKYALAVLALAALPATAVAQTPVDDARFQIERSGDQIIRLDKQTGTISTCSPDGTQLDCRMSADERAALNEEIERLSAELQALKGGDATIKKSDDTVTLKLPTEAEIRTMFGYIEEAFRKIYDAVVGLASKA